MAITIGGQTLATRKPVDLDAALVELTGCNTAETVAQLHGVPLAHMVARALVPFLGKDAAPVAELADAIAAAGVASVAADVLRLYGEDVAPVEGDQA